MENTTKRWRGGDLHERARVHRQKSWCFSQHWQRSLQLDEGTSNTCIDQIFLACEDLIDAHFICGAGGGGFLQVILKRGITKEALRKRLHSVFQDSGVDVWESEFVWENTFC